MTYTRTEAIDRLLQAYRRYYTVTRFDGGPGSVPAEEDWFREADRIVPPTGDPDVTLTAIGEYYERTGQHLLLRQNEIWAARQEEFLFLFNVTELTPERFAACRDFARDAGMSMAHIGPEHMYTYISPLFVCDRVHEEARRQLEQCRIYKTFRFPFTAGLISTPPATMRPGVPCLSTRPVLACGSPWKGSCSRRKRAERAVPLF